MLSILRLFKITQIKRSVLTRVNKFCQGPLLTILYSLRPIMARISYVSVLLYLLICSSAFATPKLLKVFYYFIVSSVFSSSNLIKMKQAKIREKKIQRHIARVYLGSTPQFHICLLVMFCGDCVAFRAACFARYSLN